MGGSNPVKVVTRPFKKVANVATSVVRTVTDPIAQVTGDAANQVLKAGGQVIGKVAEAIMPSPKIPEMPSAITDSSGDSETASSNAALIERDRADRLRRRRGRAATQLVQPSISAVPQASVATKSLLGQ